MLSYLLVAIGSAIGGVIRYCVSLYLIGGFPYATLVVNITGSLLIGFCAGLIGGGKFSISSDMQKFIMVGICGGYTTFSSFSLETLKLIEHKEIFKAGANIALSLTLALIAVYLGYVLAMTINSSSGLGATKIMR